jgi:hypothetical protein
MVHVIMIVFNYNIIQIIYNIVDVLTDCRISIANLLDLVIEDIYIWTHQHDHGLKSSLDKNQHIFVLKKDLHLRALLHLN